MSLQPLGGVLPVISTPFDDDDRIDESALRGEIDWLLSCGVDGLTIAMVSEVFRLTDTEKKLLCELVVSAVAGRAPVVASVGGESTIAAVELAVHAQLSGATALMAIPPISVGLPEGEVLGYYRAVLDSTDIPLVVQDASGYLGRPLSIDLYVALLSQYGAERVLFKPEASPIGPRLSMLRDETAGAARVFEGTGGLGLVDSYRRGVVGTMPGPDVPWALVALWHALVDGDDALVDAINGPLASMIAIQSSLDVFVAVEKHLLVKQGVITSARRRRPNGFDLDRETAIEVERLFSQLQATVGVRSVIDAPA